MNLTQIGVTAPCEGAQQVQCRRRLAIGADHALRIVRPGRGIEFDTVDDIAEIARQFEIALIFGSRTAWLGELTSHPADFHHRLLACEREHDRHLQEHAERVADIVRVKLGEAFRTIATLQQEATAIADFCQFRLKRARFTRKHQRRIGRERLFRISQHGRIFILRQVLRLEGFPPVRGPVIGHFCSPKYAT